MVRLSNRFARIIKNLDCKASAVVVVHLPIIIKINMIPFVFNLHRLQHPWWILKLKPILLIPICLPAIDGIIAVS